MKKTVFFLVMMGMAAAAQSAVSLTDGKFTLYRFGTALSPVHDTYAACRARLTVVASADTRTSGTVTYSCQQSVAARYTAPTPTPTTTPVPVPAPTQPSTGGPSISVNPPAYAAGNYATIIWDGVAPCTKQSTPAYSVWNSTPGAEGGRSVAPAVTTTFTLSCANGTRSTTLTVTGTTTPPATGSGGSTAGTGTTTPPSANLPVPTVLSTPVNLNVRTLNASDVSLAPVLKYAETARRNWNFEGHVVAVPFDTGQGYWDYDNCSTHYAVWLFDRPSAWFKLATMTGDPSYRDQAINDFRYWAGKINAQGFFSCKLGEADTKYLEILPFLSYEQATGDTSYRAVADRMYAVSAQGFDDTYSASTALWTEREVGIHLGAAVDYYRLTGNTQALARAAALVRQWTTVAGASGAPQVSYTQHEGGGPGGTQPTNLTNSPWMSAMYFQAARRYWQVTGDTEVLQQVSRYFDWLTVNGLYDGSLFHPEFAGVTVPRYLTGELIGDAGYDEGNLLHCPDVQGLVAFAADAKRRLGQSPAVADQRLNELKQCSARMWANWTRDTNYLPKYRIQAPRAWNWWLRGLYEYSLY